MKHGLLWSLLLLGLLGCDEPAESTDNTLFLTIGGERIRWDSNDGGCQLTQLSSNLICTLNNGLHESEDDFRLSLRDGDELTERAYVDVQATDEPDIDIELWLEGEGGALRRLEAVITEDQRVTIERLDLGQARGTFDGVLEDRDSGERVELGGEFTMTLEE